MMVIRVLVIAIMLLVATRQSFGDCYVEIRGGPCVLQHGRYGKGVFNIRLGRALKVECVYSIEECAGRNIINAVAVVENTTNKSIYKKYFVAFFDENGNLIGCSGNGVGPTSPNAKQEFLATCLVFLPKGVPEKVASYKIAYYESERKISTTPPQRMDSAAQANNDSDGDSENRPLIWKTLWSGKNHGYAETSEGTCFIKQGRFITNNCNFNENVFHLRSGKDMKLKTDSNFCITRFEGLSVWGISPSFDVKNTLSERMYCRVYVAFFDKDGNLVGCVDGGLSKGFGVAAGKNKPIPCMGISVPNKFYKKIVSCKMTIYESSKPIVAINKGFFAHFSG